MSPFFASFLLSVGLCEATKFFSVMQWDEMDLQWPSEEERTKALQNESYVPGRIEPQYLAVSGERLFLSLFKYSSGVPVSLVSVPNTRAAASAPPKLIPFPSWDMNKDGNCSTIQAAKGLEVDTIGRLWVLDSSYYFCKAKIWIFNLRSNDTLEHVHEFSFRFNLHDLVLEETPDGWFAYVTHEFYEHIVVFGLRKNQSWLVETQGITFGSIARSPNEGPRKLYLSKSYSDELYSISVDLLVANGNRSAKAEFIGKWSAAPYRMLTDNSATLIAAFVEGSRTASWKTTQLFREELFHKVERKITGVPFTFALDSNGSLWMTVFNKTGKPMYRLLRAVVGVKSYLFDAPKVTLSTPAGLVPRKSVTSVMTEANYTSTKKPITTSGDLEPTRRTTISTPGPGSNCSCECVDAEDILKSGTLIFILICSNVFTVFLASSLILFLALEVRRKKSRPTNSNNEEMVVFSEVQTEESTQVFNPIG